MIAMELKKLKRIHLLLIISLLVMIVSQLFTLLTSSYYYLIGVAVSAIIAAVRFYYAKRKHASPLKQSIPLLIFLIAVLGPILYVLYKVIFDSANFFSEQMFTLLFFVLPIAMMLLAVRWLNQLIQEAQSL